MKILCDRFYETARIKNMFFMGAALANGSLPRPIQDFLDNKDWETLEACFGEIPEFVKDKNDTGDNGALPSWFSHSGKLGFAVEMATPVMSGSSYSWWYYTTKWVYGDTVDAALEVGFSWVADCRDKEKYELTT